MQHFVERFQAAFACLYSLFAIAGVWGGGVVTVNLHLKPLVNICVSCSF